MVIRMSVVSMMPRACSWTRIRASILMAILLGAVLPCLLVSAVTYAQDSPRPPKRVLILYSFDNEQGLYSGFDRVLRSQLRLRVRDRVEFYTEYLDLIRFPAETHAQETVKLLKLKYSREKPDLIVPVSYSALQFVTGEGKDVFPGIPIVALFNQRRLEDLRQYIEHNPAQSITGVASADDPASTLDLALQLQPDTQHVAVIVGTSSLEHYWLDQLQHDLASFTGEVDIVYLTGMSVDDLLKRIVALPPHSVILTTFFFQDSTGQFFHTEEFLDLIMSQARVPVYSIYSTYIGHGVIGGFMTDPELTGRKVADLAAAVLNGESAARIPLVLDDSARYTVDWRQLQRWRISEKRLPAATVELFREPSLWERYRFALLAILALIFLQSGLIVGLILNVQSRRRAETALLREKVLADAVIESLPGVFFLVDAEGKNLRWNRNAQTLSRYGIGAEVPLSNIVAHDREAVRMAQRRAFEQGYAQVEANFILADGRIAPFYFTGTRVELQGKSYVAAIGIDVTDRKKAESALARSEAALRSLVEHAPYGIATIDVKQDCFLHANPAMVKLLSYESESEVCALTISSDLYAETGNQTFRAQPTRADFFNAIEFTWKRKDGKPVMVRASGRRIPQPEGDLLEIIAEDVTSRRSLEEQLRHAQKMEALGQLSGSVAHDFNNLLGVIIGYSEILSANSALESTARTHLETIKKAGERAASLTSQLLAFSRRQVLQPSVVNLNSLLRETERMLRRLLREDVEQSFVLAPSLWKTKADPSQIVQVILNLAVNARDAMPKGGRLSLETANVTFCDGFTLHGIDIPAGDYVKLSVTDTGTGMAPDTLTRIFEPFFTTKESGKGTGLGLATVYGIVKQSGGYIFAESQLGSGTTFMVYLPGIDQLAAPNSLDRQRSNGRHQQTANLSETLLVVEDESAFRELLRDGLQAQGFNVLVAANGVEALQLAEQHAGPIRILITDVIMPQMSGPELARALRTARDTEVLYMSGYTDDKLRDMTESGELVLLRKPFYLDELVQRITEILARQNRAESGNQGVRQR